MFVLVLHLHHLSLETAGGSSSTPGQLTCRCFVCVDAQTGLRRLSFGFWYGDVLCFQGI